MKRAMCSCLRRLLINKHGLMEKNSKIFFRGAERGKLFNTDKN